MAEEEKEEKPEGGAGAENAEAAEEGGKKKGKKKKLMIIGIAAVLLLVLAGGGGAAYFILIKPKQTEAQKQQADASDEKGKPVYFSLGDQLVNLSGEGKHPNFLKVKISLELTDEKDLPVMEAIKPRIIDNFQVYLRELRIEDLRGSAGMYRLREELLMRVTEAAAPVRVRDVLFQEMLVQ